MSLNKEGLKISIPIFYNCKKLCEKRDDWNWKKLATFAKLYETTQNFKFTSKALPISLSNESIKGCLVKRGYGLGLDLSFKWYEFHEQFPENPVGLSLEFK